MLYFCITAGAEASQGKEMIINRGFLGIFFAAVMGLMTACGTGDDGAAIPADPGPKGIGPQGGTVQSPDGKASVTIPEGALPEEVVITISGVSGVLGDPGQIGIAYEFGPNGTFFDLPVTIRIVYEESDLPQGVTEDSLILGTFVDGQWVAVADGQVNAETNTVSGTTDHFSRFATISTGLTANTAPVAHDASIIAEPGGTTSGTLSATDAENDSLTFRIVAQPTQGTVSLTNVATGAFSYTASTGASTTDVFTFVADDGRAVSNVGTITVTIQPLPNGAPTATDISLELTAGSSGGGILSAFDPNGDPLTFRITSQGTKGNASLTDDKAGTFTYTANPGTSGSDAFTFVANDGQVDSNTATVNVTINPPSVLYRLGLTKSQWGNGVIEQSAPADDPNGLLCDLLCESEQHDYLEYTSVELTATPSLGSTTATWGGCDSVSADGLVCTVLMSTDKVIEVEFDATVEIKTLPRDDIDGSFSLGWECLALEFCSLGQYVIQEDSNDNFSNPIEYTASAPDQQLPHLGGFIYLDYPDGTHCFRARRPTAGASPPASRRTGITSHSHHWRIIWLLVTQMEWRISSSEIP